MKSVFTKAWYTGLILVFPPFHHTHTHKDTHRVGYKCKVSSSSDKTVSVTLMKDRTEKHSCTQSGQERVVYDVCVLQKLAGVVLEVGTVINRGKSKEQRGKNKG